MKRLLVSWGVWMALAASAQQATDHGDVPSRIGSERKQLQQERAALEQAHEVRMRECWQRFAVNDCLREVRRSRRAVLDPLRERELQLNAQDRAWRTQQRDERLRDKGAERQP
jgi:hypothetical protein